MWLAAKEKGDAHAVVAWLDEGGGVDARSAKDMTLLMAAAGGGHEATVRMLLQRGASVNLQHRVLGGTALMLAAVNGRSTIVQALLDAKADASLQNIRGDTALTLAGHRKHIAAAQLLQQHAKQQAVEAEDEARAAAKAAHAAAATDAVAAEVLTVEAAEKEAAAKKGKGKMKKARAPSTAAAESAAAAPLAGPPKPAAAQEKLPDEPSS
jgi:ankyrin repeat protein